MESCIDIVVEDVEIIPAVDEIALIVSGIVGLIVGGIIAFIVFMCFIKKPNNSRSNRVIGVEIQDNKMAYEETTTSLTYENIATENTTVSKTRKFQKQTEKDFLSFMESSKNTPFFVLEEFVNNKTWDKMVLELGKQELFEILKLEQTLWKERHTCLLQWYRSCLNAFLAMKLLSESNHIEILTKQERFLSASLEKMKSACVLHIDKISEQSQSLMDSYITSEGEYANVIKNIITEYRESQRLFIKSISLFVNKETLEVAQNNLTLHVDAIEGSFRENQDELIESLRLLYHGFGSIVRKLVIAILSERELNRLLCTTCNISLEKLVKTGRISTISKEKLNESLHDMDDISTQDMRDVFSRAGSNNLANYETRLEQHEEESSRALQSILNGYANQSTCDGFIENYLSACCEQKLRKWDLVKKHSEGEFSEMTSKLSELSNMQTKKRSDFLNSFCQDLEESDALSRSELQQMSEELNRRTKASQFQVYESCESNMTELWNLYDMHCSKEQEEENAVDASILQDAATDNLLSIESILSLQNQLTNEDRTAVMHERESLFLLLVNQINLYRAKWFHVIENDLAKCQAFLLTKNSAELVKGKLKKDILGIVERLWNERNVMRNYVRETASITCIKPILATSDNEICKFISQTLVSISLQQRVTQHHEQFLYEAIKRVLIDEISQKNASVNYPQIVRQHDENLASMIREDMNRHELATSIAEDEVRATNLKRQGRLNIKAQRIAQHIPPRGNNAYDVQPYLEQILLQFQVMRAADFAENESSQQTLLERLAVDKSSYDNLSELTNDSETLLLCKFAAAARFSKTEFNACINRAKEETGSSGNEKKISQKLQRSWKNALAYIDNVK